MRTEVNINANILTWAIARAGYKLHEFTIKVPKVQDWIDGKKKPTVKQLEAFSRKVHLPFGYLFLSEPPSEDLPIPFFRTIQSDEEKVSINIYDTVLIMQQRQEWLKEYLSDNDFEPLHFVGKYNNSQNVNEIVTDIRNTLGLNYNWASKFKTWHEALEHLTTKIEDAGIITVFNGVVENNTSRPIKVEECRGFVMTDNIAPFMFVNNADGKAAQMFTIAHELAHVWTGHSAGFDFRKLEPANDPIELLCDKVAAEFLVPEIEFIKVWDRNPKISSVARYFKVSEIVIARRALDTNKISKSNFYAFYEEYINREYEQKAKSSGGDFYATTKKRLSMTFAAHVYNAVKSEKLLYRDAYKLTSLKGDTFQTFFTKHF
ncbi:MAG: ImmA/IrrE family metallo-endopeptidase [Bacteroidales bacterium]|nr:ImmA/IrrE family metallo-endopeptidase [Bacteroidales bacterium]MCF8328118.1 ImmA/IrrE family metallo-endopeptidase [Bacteroidales bacterium]